MRNNKNLLASQRARQDLRNEVGQDTRPGVAQAFSTGRCHNI